MHAYLFLFQKSHMLALEDVLGAIPLQSLPPGRHPIVDMTDTLDGKVRLHLMSSGGEEYYTSAPERFLDIIKQNFDDYKKMGFEVNLCVEVSRGGRRVERIEIGRNQSEKKN